MLRMRGSLMKKAGLFTIMLSAMIVTLVVLTSALPVQLESNGQSMSSIQGAGDTSSEPTFNLTSLLKKYFAREGLDEKGSVSSDNDESPIQPVVEISDDARFLQILGEKTFSFHVLTLQMIIALDQSDPTLVWTNAGKMRSQAAEVSEEVESLNVHPSNLIRKQEFIQSMEDYIEISTTLDKGVPRTVSARREIVEDLSRAANRLQAVLYLSDDTAHPDDNGDQFYHLTSLSSASHTLHRPGGILDCGSPYTYLDPKQSNEISIVPRYSRFASSLWYETIAGTTHQHAPDGKTYLLVFIQVVHRGNLDGKHYTISTPAPSAFTLHGTKATYKPLMTPAHTSLGEMYLQRTLNRKENCQSFLIFEVPKDFSLSDYYLSAFLGSEYGTVSWNIT